MSQEQTIPFAIQLTWEYPFGNSFRSLGGFMASKTKKTELKRKRRDKRGGTKRKAALKNQGSTKSPKVLFKD